MEPIQNTTILGGILIGVITIILVFVCVLSLVYRYRTKKTEQEAQLAKKQLKQQHEMVELEIRSQEIVRERISADLHDTLGSLFFGAKLNAAVLLKTIEGNTDAEEIGKEIIESMNRGMNFVREVAMEITPQTFLTLGLSQCVQDFCEKVRKKQVEIIIEEHGNIFNWNNERALQAYRILQELIYNSSRHSGTDKVMVYMRWLENEIEIKVTDFGIGLTSQKSTNGLGLWNIQIRVRHLRGQFSIVNNYNKPGTTAIVVIPYL